MKKHLTIREMARLTHLTEHTLRYYERIGLLKAVARGSSGHRQYSPNDQAWVEFLVRLRATGMPIRDMQRFAELRQQGDQTASERRTILETHLDIVRKDLIELQDCERILIDKIAYYQNIEHSIKSSTNTKAKR